MKTIICTLASLILLLGAPPAPATQSKTFGAHVVHYNAFTADAIPPSVARAYGIQRSEHRGVLNVTVLRKGDDPMGTPVDAEVLVQATNLTGQTRPIGMRRITEQDAIYYIGEFRVTHRENITFDIRVTPAGSADTGQIRFSQEFFTR